MEKIIYIGDQAPCIFHLLKNLKVNNKSKYMLLSVPGRRTEHINLMIWSSIEIEFLKEIFSSKFPRSFKPSPFCLEINSALGKFIFGGCGKSNLIELLRKIKLGCKDYEDLLDSYDSFFEAYSKLSNEIIRYGKYNTYSYQTFLESLPKVYQNFFKELYHNDQCRSLLVDLSSFTGCGVNFFLNEPLTTLSLSKILSGVHFFDIRKFCQVSFSERFVFRHIDFLDISNLGSGKVNLKFGGYEGSEIVSQSNIFVSELFKEDYLKNASLLKLDKHNNIDLNFGSFRIHCDTEMLPVLVKNERVAKGRGVIHGFEDLNMRICPLTLDTVSQSVNYIEHNHFGLSPYLTYLFS
tara:strand:- start:8902 stop:9951 length:1050 start_codon:yes stop_codon:yes gene_type:complete